MKEKAAKAVKTQPRMSTKMVVVTNNYATSPLIGSDNEVGKVYETYDYSKFKFFAHNRKISAKNKTKLLISIKKVGQLQNILVDPKFNIGEGQHRFEILRENSLPVRYEVRSTYDIQQIRETQQGMPWKHADILNYYTKHSDPAIASNYKLYKDFHARFGLGHNMTIAFITGRYSNAVDNEAFAEGRLKVDKQQYENAFKEAQQLEQFKPLHKRYKNRSFVLAYFTLIKKVKGYNHRHMIVQLSKYQNELKDNSRADLYVFNLRDIYNKYARKEDRLIVMPEDLITNA